MPIYMKFGDVKGNVTEKEHKDWISLTSLQTGTSRHLSNATGQKTQREGSQAVHGEITVSKLQDSSSSQLWHDSLRGKGVKVEIHFVETPAGGSPEVYIQMELEETLLASYSIGGGDQVRPTESLSLNFTKITFTTFLMNPDGTKGDPVVHIWDLGTMTGS